MKHLGRDGEFVITSLDDIVKIDSNGEITSIVVKDKNETTTIVNGGMKIYENEKDSEIAKINGTADVSWTDEGYPVINAKRDKTQVKVNKDHTVVKNDGRNTRVEIYGQDTTVFNSSGPLTAYVYRSGAKIYGSDFGDTINIEGYYPTYGTVSNVSIYGGAGNDVMMSGSKAYIPSDI